MAESETLDPGVADLSDQQELLEEAGEAIGALIDTLELLAERVQALQPVVDEIAPDTIEALDDSIASLAEQTGETAQSAEQAHQAMVEEANGAVFAIGEQVQEAHAHVASIVAGLGDEEHQLGSHFASLQEAFDATQERIAGAYEQHLQSLDAAQRDLAGFIGQHHDEQLATGTEQIASTITGFAASAEGITRELIETLSMAVVGLADAVEQSVHRAEAERAPAQLALDAVQAVLDPLMAEVSRIQDLASSVGISL